MHKLTVGAAVLKILVFAIQLLPVEQVAVEVVSQSRANFGVPVLAAQYPDLQSLQSGVWNGRAALEWRPQARPEPGFEAEQTLRADLAR